MSGKKRQLLKNGSIFQNFSTNAIGVAVPRIPSHLKKRQFGLKVQISGEPTGQACFSTVPPAFKQCSGRQRICLSGGALPQRNAYNYSLPKARNWQCAIAGNITRGDNSDIWPVRPPPPKLAPFSLYRSTVCGARFPCRGSIATAYPALTI